MGRGGPFRRDRQARHQGLAVDFQGVRPQVERRTVEQGGLFGLVEARSRHGLGQPRGQHPALRHRLSGHDRRRAIRRPVEQPRQRAIGLRQTQHGRPARGRNIATGADRRPRQLADRAAILRADEAALAEPLGGEAVRRSSPTRRSDDLIQNVDRGLDPRSRGHRVG
jgi:hypothetical protein